MQGRLWFSRLIFLSCCRESGLQEALTHCLQAAVLQELRNSGILDLFFVCAKSEVHQVSQPAISCLVLIWQWYLRRSPAASFSTNEMSCFFPEATAGGSPATAVGATPYCAATAVGSSGSQRPVAAQLWSVEPAIDFATDRATPSSPPVTANASGPAPQQQSHRRPADTLRDGIGAPSNPGVGFGRAPLPPKEANLPFGLSTSCQSPEAAAAMHRPPSSSRRSGCIPRSPPQDQAPPACLSPLLACTKPRLPSATMLAESTGPSPIPVGGGQFVSRPASRAFAAPASSASALGLSSPGTPPKANPLATPNRHQGTSDGLSSQFPYQLPRTTSSAASVPQQQACQHSMPSANSPHNSSLSCSHPQSRNAMAMGAPLEAPPPPTPNQHAGLRSNVCRETENSSQSSSPLPAAAGGGPKADQADALDHNLPQGTSTQGTSSQGAFSQPNQALLLPAVGTSAQALEQHTQPEPVQHIHTWLDSNPEGHWQPLPVPHPPPSVQARAEGHERQPLSAHERQHGQPTQRVLQYSPIPTSQPGDQELHSRTLGRPTA